MSEPEFLCARCARHMRTCCQTCEIYVSPGDVKRIGDHVGRTDFHEMRRPEDDVYLDHDDDPPWRDHVFRADGTRRVLRRQPSGDCTFLGSQGCTLPLEVRPLVCRLFPYDYDAGGIRQDLAGGCPTHLVRPDWDLIRELDMRPDDAHRWHRQLYEEIQLEQPVSADNASADRHHV
jgi:Fe-S-cluster containining protein